MKNKFKENIETLEGLIQYPSTRRLDANCTVFLKKWVDKERQEAQNELLKELKRIANPKVIPACESSKYMSIQRRLNIFIEVIENGK